MSQAPPLLAEDPEPLIYALRPERTSLWLPESVANGLGIRRGDVLSAEQFASEPVQRLISERRAAR